MSCFFFQREFSNDCVFNERMQDNYNYYTSTYHSTSLKTFYVALNRLGGPRKTHIPSNKALGKLSTYVKSITLTVPEQRANSLVARLFGENHIKHGLKHLCTSNKALVELIAKNMVQPLCDSKKIVAIPTKGKPAFTGPAALMERNQKKSTVPKCTQGPCPKKKKKSKSGTGTLTSESEKRIQEPRTEIPLNKSSTAVKPKKKAKNKHRHKHTTTSTTTEMSVITVDAVDENIITDAEDEDDEIPSTGPSAFTSDGNDDYGYES